MAKLLASSQITIVDLNDAVSLRSYIKCSHARMQFLTNNGTYVPDYSNPTEHVILSAELNKVGDNTNLVTNPGTTVSRVDWYIKLAPSQEYVKVTPAMTEYELIGTAPFFSGLKIKDNIMDKSHPGMTIKSEIDFKELWMEDVHTQITEIDFNLTAQGEDGTDAYTAILTNASHTIICNADGSADDGEIGINGRAVSDTVVYKGTKVLTAVANNPVEGQYSITLDPTNCTASKKSNNAFYIDTLNSATASINSDGNLKSNNINVKNVNNGGKVKVSFNIEGNTTIHQEMTFSKVYNGADGLNGHDGKDGESAKYITLAVKEGTTVFKYDKGATTPNVSKTILEAIKFNINDATYAWSYFANGSWTPIAGQTSSMLTVNATDSYFTSNSSVTFKCTVNGLYSDQITINKIVDGSDSILVQLSNESHVISCTSGGAFKPGESTRAVTEVTAYKGSTPLTLVSVAPTQGQYKIGVEENSSVTYTLTDNVIKITDMTADSAVLVINVNCEGTIYKKTMSLSKAKDGREGVDGILAILTNEYHAVPANASGTVSSYTGCSTSIELYKGDTVITEGVTYSVTPNNGITGSLTGNTYTVTGLTTDISSVNLTATYNGKSYSKTFTVAKNKQGANGTDSTSYWIIPNTTSVNKNKDGVLSPTSITYTAKKQTGSQALADFAGRFKIYTSTNKGQTYSVAYTSTANESSKNFGLSNNTWSAIKCELYLENGTTLVDTQTIVFTTDGTDGQDGKDAAYVLVTGESMFKYGPNFIGNPVPNSILLTRSLFNTSGGKWQYHDDTDWVDFNPAQTSATLEVTPILGHFATSSNKVMRVRYSVSDTVYDETSIIKVADGATGSSAYTVILTNESHIVAANTSGALLTGEAEKATTNVVVYKGSELVNNFALTKVSDEGIVTNVDNSKKTITLTSMPNANTSGKCTVKIAVEGQEINKVFSITKSKQAANGSSAKMLSLTSEGQTFKYGAKDNISTSVPTPGSIKLTLKEQNLSSTTRLWEYKPSTVSEWTQIVATVDTNPTEYNVNPTNVKLFPNGAYACQIRCTVDGLTDYVTISKVQDGTSGTDAYTVVLSNPSHTVTANSSGVVSNLATATTDIVVYKGSASVVPTVNNLVAVPATAKFTLTQATSTTAAKITMTEFPANIDSATCTVDVVAGGQTLKQTFTVTKAKQGVQGSSVKGVFVSGPQVFKYAKNATTPAPASITLSAVERNFTGSARKWYQDGTVITGQTGTNLVVDHNASYWGSKTSITFKYEADGITDEITVTKMYDGTDTYSVVLTNESHTITCNKDGAPNTGELDKALTKVRVFRGATELTASNTAGIDKFVITTKTTMVDGSGTCAYVVENSANVGVKLVTVTKDSGVIPIDINIDNGKTTIQKLFTFSKAKAGATGAAGTNAKVIQITGANSIIYTKSGAYDPADGITLTIQKKNTTADVVWKVNGTQVGTGDTYKVPTTVFDSTKTYTIKAELSGDASVYDTHTISKVSDGTDSVTSYIWCPNGSTIRNDNVTSLDVEAVIFSGLSNVSTNGNAKYHWQKKVGANWVDIKGTAAAPIAGNAGGNTITINQSDIPYMLIVKCTMKYGSAVQTDTTVLEDINDPVHSTILSTAGTTFKNGVGETFLIAKAIRNAVEIDTIRLVQNVPTAAGAQGEVVYVKSANKYYKYNNTAWGAIATPTAGDNSTYSYTWTKADSEGNIITGWTRTGKVIYISSEDINQKNIFMVDVEG